MSGPVNLDENIEKINCQTFKTDKLTTSHKKRKHTYKQTKKTPENYRLKQLIFFSLLWYLQTLLISFMYDVVAN